MGYSVHLVGGWGVTAVKKLQFTNCSPSVILAKDVHLQQGSFAELLCESDFLVHFHLLCPQKLSGTKDINHNERKHHYLSIHT